MVADCVWLRFQAADRGKQNISPESAAIMKISRAVPERRYLWRI